MRELKFRAWDTVRRRWLSGGYGFHILGEANLMGGLFSEYCLSQQPHLNDIAITQFTGLPDKNGKDIYEGDILRHHKYGGDHEVKWIDESCGFFLGEQSWALTALCSSNIEVVGTIYEPELDTLGTFEEMLTLASERALADDGTIVVHRQGCDGVDDCLCQPKIVQPYEPVEESTTKPQ